MTTIEQRRVNAKNYRERWYRSSVHVDLDPRPEIPASVLAERNRRRELAPISLTAALMGDPLPGRSALDRQ